MNYSHLGLPSTIVFYLTIIPTGSRFNCDPPVMNTDQDYLVYSSTDIDRELELCGYVKYDPNNDPNNLVVSQVQQSVPKKSGNPDETFTSWRKDDINLIVTRSIDFFEKHKVAGYVCKALNLLNKDDRIMVYHAIMYGEFDGKIDQGNIPATKKTNIDFFAINKVFST